MGLDTVINTGIDQNPDLMKRLVSSIFGQPVAPGATPPMFGKTAPALTVPPGGAATPSPSGAAPAPAAVGTAPAPAAPAAPSTPMTAPRTSAPSAGPGEPWKPGTYSAALNNNGGNTEPGNQPPPRGSTPSVLSEDEWNKQHPLAPHTPYQAPDFKHRLLAGIFAGMQEYGHKGEGAETARRYEENVRSQVDREKAYPQTSAEQQHAGYERYVQGVKAPLDLQDLQAQITERQAKAQKDTDTRALEREYSKAVTSGDDEKAQRYADAIGELRGEMRPDKTHTPYGDWREQNPHAPVENWLKTEQDAKPKTRTNPFEAFAYGTPDEKQSAKDFIALEGKQRLQDRAPSEVEQRYALFQKDPDGYKSMYGERGGAQEQAQAARMLKFFDGRRKEIEGDFTLDDQTKQQRLSEIGELEKPYLDAAKVGGPSGGAAAKKNAGGASGDGPRAGEIEVNGPNGEHGYIPRAKLAKAKTLGWKQVE